MRHKLLLVLLSCMLSQTAQAATPPPEVAQTIPAASMNGAGTLSFLWMDAYKAELWTKSGAWAADKPFALSLTYNMNFTSDELVGRTLEEMQRVVSKEESEKFTAALQKSFPDVKKGDRITGIFLPPDRTLFYHNNTQVNSVTDAGFGPLFFGIWLGPNTSEPSLRAKLLAIKE